MLVPISNLPVQPLQLLDGHWQFWSMLNGIVLNMTLMGSVTAGLGYGSAVKAFLGVWPQLRQTHLEYAKLVHRDWRI